ncbi:MAG: hypothetical protein GX053_12685 [Tissierella sp.]|nr:hypothetical protein [Tissierella sp.]
MQDEKLDKLIKEVHRLEVIYDECEPAAIMPILYELKAAEERLNLYFEEKRTYQSAN